MKISGSRSEGPVFIRVKRAVEGLKNNIEREPAFKVLIRKIIFIPHPSPGGEPVGDFRMKRGKSRRTV